MSGFVGKPTASQGNEPNETTFGRLNDSGVNRYVGFDTQAIRDDSSW